MSVQLFAPIALTDAMLVGSSLAEDTTPPWVGGGTYAAGDEVHLASTHRRYRSLADGNIGNNPATSAAQWLNLGPTNRWAPFDGAVGTAAAAAESIRYTLRPAQAVTSLALFGLVNATSVRVVMRDTATAAVVYDRTVSLSSVLITDWLLYFTAPFSWRDRVLLSDLPIYGNTELEITLQGNGLSPVQVGSILMGAGYAFAPAMAGLRVGWTDYSRVVEDAFGVAALVQRPRLPRLQVQFTVEPDQFNGVWGALESLASQPLVVSVSQDERHTGLTLYGFFREPQIDLRTAGLYFCSIEFRGIT